MNSESGCPGCGGSDIDLATDAPPPGYPRRRPGGIDGFDAYMNQERKAIIAAELKKVIPKGWKWSLGVRHHSTIVLTIAAAPIDLLAGQKHAITGTRGGHLQLNVYHPESHFQGDLLVIFREIIAAMNTGNWDKSDSQSDYFNVGWYVDVDIGKWDKPFKVLPQILPGGVRYLPPTLAPHADTEGTAWSKLAPERRSERVGWSKSGEFYCPNCSTIIGKSLTDKPPYDEVVQHLQKHIAEGCFRDYGAASLHEKCAKCGNPINPMHDKGPICTYCRGEEIANRPRGSEKCPLCLDMVKNRVRHLVGEHGYEVEDRVKNPDDPVIAELSADERAALRARLKREGYVSPVPPFRDTGDFGETVTVKTLIEAFPKLEYEDARRLLDLVDKVNSDRDVEHVMEIANEMLDGHGVEALNDERAHRDSFWQDAIASYVNLGDPYVTTILYDTENSTFLIGNWGDFLEKWESELEENEDAEGESLDDVDDPESDFDGAERDPYTMKHLNAWLDQEIHGDTVREKVKACMLKLFDEDPEYWSSQSWWNLYDRAGCREIERS